MKVLCLVTIIIAVVVVAQAAPDNDQTFVNELAKENDSKSHVQMVDLMGIDDMQAQQFVPPEYEAESQKQQQIYVNQIDNEWQKRKQLFQKIAKADYPIDADYKQDDPNLNNLLPPSYRDSKCKNSSSKLPTPIKDLICLIFNLDSMERTMMEFGIDLIKMPLEKLSKNQIMKAYEVLTKIQTALSNDMPVDQIQIDDASDRFYTIIPHDFGMQKPPLLNNTEFVKTRIDMLNNLLEIEFTYSIIKESSRNSSQDLIDYYYSKLKNQIDILDNSTKQFSVISKYITNNHNLAYFNITLTHIFKIARQGEEKRYKPFKQMPNRQLLWHGSRITNFAGILSKGLQIARAHTGLFGKGIYFADVFDLSASYSWNGRNSTALLLLSEVALGEMYELISYKAIKKLPKGKQSVKGVGQVHPDPSRSFLQANGAKVPYGFLVPSNFERAYLYYPMYIMFDEAQINQQYLVQVHFS